MTVETIMQQLEEMGNEGTKRVLMKHGAREPFFGVKVGDLKKIVKKVKKNHDLSLALYKTGNSDAMYLAGLIADEKQITVEILDEWVEGAYWYMISEYTVPWIAADSGLGWEMGLKWTQAESELIQAAGWSALSNVISTYPDEDLDHPKIEELLDYVSINIHQAQNRVRYTMNGFVISTGAYIPSLTDRAMSVAGAIGKVSVDMGGTACKVPLATQYIDKIVKLGRLGKKRKMARC